MVGIVELVRTAVAGHKTSGPNALRLFWVAVKELEINYHYKDTILCGIYPYEP